MKQDQRDQQHNRLIIVRPVCELQGRTKRMEDILGSTVEMLEQNGTEIVWVVMASELKRISLVGERVLFAICLSEAGVNMEYYRLLEWFRGHPDCLKGAVGANFNVLAKVYDKTPYEMYRQQAQELALKLLTFDYPIQTAGQKSLKVVALHASSRKTSNSFLLWDQVRQHLEPSAQIREISLRNGSMLDCRGCPYEECLHYGENDGCFYGGIMTEQVYPAILECDVLIMICPNYNDAVGANLTAFINRLTSIFRVHDFSRKRVYALVISGYSGGDIVAEQIIGALNFNKAFILPAGFCMVETANDPESIMAVPDIRLKAAAFADRILDPEL